MEHYTFHFQTGLTAEILYINLGVEKLTGVTLGKCNKKIIIQVSNV